MFCDEYPLLDNSPQGAVLRLPIFRGNKTQVSDGGRNDQSRV